MATNEIPNSKRTVIIVDPAGGLAGDMFLAGLLALGADPEKIARKVRTLPDLERFSIRFGKKKWGSIVAHRAIVECEPSSIERDHERIEKMIDRSLLDRREKELARAVFRTLAEAEARVHGIRASNVHFHEIGAVDSIVDIVGSVVALSELGYPKLYHLPFRLGGGFVETAHGRLPLPAPATMEILRGRTVRFVEEEGETVTPTGAALAKTLARELPREAAFKASKVVYSCGTRDSGAEPGLLRMICADRRSLRCPIYVIRATIDDMNPQIYGHIFELLFDMGAREVYLAQVLMKKGRPGVELNVLCDCEKVDSILEAIFEETTTIGARVSVEAREELERWVEEVKTCYGPIKVKKAILPGGAVKVAPEYESCKRAAKKFGAPLSKVSDAARCAAVSQDRSHGKRSR